MLSEVPPQDKQAAQVPIFVRRTIRKDSYEMVSTLITDPGSLHQPSTDLIPNSSLLSVLGVPRSRHW